jgi:hypothetical protein
MTVALTPTASISNAVDSLTVSSTGGLYTITSNGSNVYPWTSTAGGPWANTASPKIRLDGPGADIEINGESLIGMLRRIEERLNILTPNSKLESEWEELRALGEQYRKLEQYIKDKQATWDRLKVTQSEID